MNRTDKSAAIELLKDKFSASEFFYLTDSSTLTVEQVNNLRRKCFEEGVEMKVVKNTMAIKALQRATEESYYEPLYEALKGPTAIMFTETANIPAKIIEEFRKKHDRPILKAAFIDKDVYIGDDKLTALAALKSKEELIGDVILLLQSPMKKLVGALQSGGNTLSGLVKALGERGES
jgi:large subunit ribosomal protein L10